MKIIRADIFGFGKWIDKTFHFHDTSLICFYGENESGKTTLQQFLIYMLFGFPPRKRAVYKPKMSSTIGGRLILTSKSVGQFTIERLNDEVTCYLADGTTQNEEWLQKQLNGMTEEMYRSIYSFSALDLSGIQEMKDESLGEILFSIGLTGATNIYTVERNIDRKIGDLFKPSGRVPKINKQLSKLNNLQNQLSKLEKMEESYRQKKEHQSLLIHRLNKLEMELAQYKKTLFTYEKIRHSLPTIQDFHHYEEQLKNYNDMPFPENGVERLNDLKNEMIPLQSDLGILTDNKHKYKQKYDDINSKLSSNDLYETALNIQKQKQLYIENKHSYELINEKIINNESQINQILNMLDIGLTEEEISQISFPFHSEMTWTELNRENELLELEKDQLLDEEHILLRKQEKLSEDKSLIKNRQLPADQVESLKAKLNKDEQIKGQLKDQRDREKNWLKTKAERLNNMKTILYSSVGIGIVSFIIGTIFKTTFLNVIGIFIIMFGFIQQIMSKRSIQEIESVITYKIDEENNVTTLSNSDRQHFAQIIEEQEALKNELILLEKTMRELHIEEIQLEERNHLFKQKQLKHKQLIEEERTQYSFLSDISVIHWLDLRENLKEIQDNLSQKKKLNIKLIKYEQDINKIEEQLKSFYEQINEKDSNPTIEYIDTWLQNERDLLREKEQYKVFLADISEKEHTISKQYDIYNDKITELFKLAKVDSEEKFLEVANMIAQYEDLTNKKQGSLHQISLTFGEEGKEDILEKKLNENEVELKITSLNNQIKEVERELNENRDQLAQLEASLKQLEQSEDYSEMIHLLEIEQQKLAELTFDWTVLQTAKEALNEAKRSYRNKYLTEVINKTSYYFSLITNKSYIKVFPPTDDNPFLVESPDHVRYEVGELSQGTVDQLYVSLRLAISEVMSERFNVPFIIDDAFVHFDATRTNNIVDVLLEIGKKQQILFFTCKHDVKQFVPEQMIQQIDKSMSVN